jgi:hypothetical protein
MSLPHETQNGFVLPLWDRGSTHVVILICHRMMCMIIGSDFPSFSPYNELAVNLNYLKYVCVHHISNI